MARRSGDAGMLRSVLLAWHLNAAFHGHETLERRLAVADELVERAATAGDLRTLAFARHWRTIDSFEAGEIDQMEAELDRAAALAGQLREPLVLWAATYPRATLALLGGELADAERLAREALAAGERTEFTDMEGRGCAAHRRARRVPRHGYGPVGGTGGRPLAGSLRPTAARSGGPARSGTSSTEARGAGCATARASSTSPPSSPVPAGSSPPPR